MTSRRCADCGADISGRGSRADRCVECEAGHEKARRKAYSARPDVKARAKARNATPEAKAKRKAYSKAYYATPEGRAKVKAYDARPEVKARRRTLSATPPRTIICRHCQTPFQVGGAGSGHGGAGANRQYCSPGCKSENLAIRRNNPSQRRACVICSEPFVTTQLHGQSQRKYCGRACRSVGIKRAMTLTCVGCSDSFTVVTRARKSLNRQFCSVTCRDRARPRRPIGALRTEVSGYTSIKVVGPRAWRLQHTVVMEQNKGRPLYDHENVHHLNGIRDDNRIENLDLWSTSQPSGQRVVDKLAWCQWFLAQYTDTQLELVQ